eukprot:TRINITY_DN1382_c0_g1_i1.p1 TRINITY_DN1382_c0_g1~~TRINITY_DN1382_c0_g1_i1.p1  ORF type:complete len:316 (+),score=36.82 TRINITY_DN1382_c0_g1_i1:23-970(+)
MCIRDRVSTQSTGRFPMRSLAFFCLLAFCCFSNCQPSGPLVSIGPNFWNARTVFKAGPLNVGSHMSLIQLSSGKFLVLDTVALTQPLLDDFNQLTKNGTLIEAVVATHPFHTVFFPSFYEAYPNAPYFGTPRHLRIQPNIPWKGSVYDCEVRQKWNPEVEMRIPRGSEFAYPQYESIHFTGMHVFHVKSKTIHVDDTIMIDVPLKGNMLFHPTLLYEGLYHIPEAPYAFRDWTQKMINEWNFDNIVAAHNGIKVGGAKSQLQKLLDNTSIAFTLLSKAYGISPNSTDAAFFQAMEKHESQCKEYSPKVKKLSILG